MKLSDLEPGFLRYVEEEGRVTHHYVEHISEATGVQFLCPKCFAANGGRIGTHLIICWAPSVPQNARPGPGRWKLVGTGLDDLSLVAGSSSVHITGGCQWHGFVENGNVRDA